MKILFLLKNTGLHERLGIMTLSSILKQRGHSVKLLITEDMSEDECITEVKKLEPHILAYSVMTGEHNYYIGLNQKIRKHYEAFSVFGGPHPTFMSEMIEIDKVDAICRGEGDIYFPQLVDYLEDGKDFYHIPNFWFKKPDGGVVRNGSGALVENIDDLPVPDRALIYDSDSALRSRGSKLFMSMRGCPYQCSYCFNHVYSQMMKGKGKMLRYRSVDNLIHEIKEVKMNYFLDRVYIDDDTFLLKPEGWLEEFAQKYPKEIGLPLTCNVRANLVSEKVGKLLQKMNCHHVFMGVECGNNDIASNVLKRNISNEQIMNACEILHKNKIKIWTQNLVGLPIDNPLEVDLQTLDFNIRLRSDFGWASILYPYPGTEISRVAVDKGMFNENFGKINVSNKTVSSLDFGDEKLKRKIVNLHKLFGIIVQFPFLRPLTPFLISLPLTRVYTWVYFAFYGYKTLTQSSARGIYNDMKLYIPFYFKYVATLEKQHAFSNARGKSTYPASILNDGARK